MSDPARQGRSGGLIPGLVKGLATTARSVTRRHHTAEYPDAKPALPPRTRGVIALTEENCTSCMLCARECPDWCIYIDSHKEEIPAATPGGRARQRNVLDRFAIDFSLCMYCGICIEVCPFDALHWSPEFEYAELDVRDLLHEKDRLGEWMATVPPPPALDPGSPDPAEVIALTKPARPAGPAAPAARATTARRAATPGSVPPEAVQPAEPDDSPASGAAPAAGLSPAPRVPAEGVATRVLPAQRPGEEPSRPGASPEVASHPDETAQPPAQTRVMPAVDPTAERPAAATTVPLPAQSPASPPPGPPASSPSAEEES